MNPEEKPPLVLLLPKTKDPRRCLTRNLGDCHMADWLYRNASAIFNGNVCIKSRFTTKTYITREAIPEDWAKLTIFGKAFICHNLSTWEAVMKDLFPDNRFTGLL